MKRLFAYIIATVLFSQVMFAVILVQKPAKGFSLSQTYIVPARNCKNKSYFAPKLWLSQHCKKQNVDWTIERFSHPKRHNIPNRVNRIPSQRKLCQMSQQTFVTR